MTIRFTFLLILYLLTYMVTNAQVEQVSVGKSYSHQAFYKLSTGEVIQVPNEAWDIAFSNAGAQDAGIFINESSTFMTNPLKLYVAEETDWSTDIADVSKFTDDKILYNQELNWTEGAFNSIKDTSSTLDYGWGKYNLNKHFIEGNKIYVVKKRNGPFIKLQILQLKGGVYSFRYADLDGANEVNATASKNEAGENPLIYFSFETGSKVDMPSDYDLVFQRYTTPINNGTGTIIEYTVTGVLLAPHVTAVVADGVDPSTVLESDYSNLYSATPNTIGYDWKTFDFASGWIIDDDRANFVKTSDGSIYKIVFYDFEGSSSGIVTLEKTEIETVSSSEVPLPELKVFIYPNPTTDFIHFKGQQNDLDIGVYDDLGRLVLSKKIKQNSPQVSLNHLQSGQYTIVVSNLGIFTQHHIIVNK